MTATADTSTTQAAEGGLPDDLLSWVAATAGGQVVRAARHSARREGWQIEVRETSGANARYFLRIDRALAKGRGSLRNLRRETALIRTLAEHGIPAQRILGWNDQHCAALQSWVGGEGDLNRADRAHQHRVMLEFMEILARLHRIDIGGLSLPEFVVPGDAVQHSMLEVEAVEEPRLFPVSACAINPLAAFGKRWLLNHAPAKVEATVLLQGDTGPANFMYDDKGVTAVVDWEWGHYGDPMEDLGNIWVRDFFYPSSDYNLAPYFEHYAKLTGFALDREKILYYRVHQLARSVIGLTYLTARFDWQTTIPLNLGYRAVVDIETCRALAEAGGIDFEPLAQPGVTVDESTDSLYVALAKQCEALVAPHIQDAFAGVLNHGHAAVMRYLDRRERHGAACDAQELAGLRGLLGSGVADLAAGRNALLHTIETLAIADEPPVLEHLSRVAANQAALMRPLMEPWLDRRWASIDPR